MIPASNLDWLPQGLKLTPCDVVVVGADGKIVFEGPLTALKLGTGYLPFISDELPRGPVLMENRTLDLPAGYKERLPLVTVSSIYRLQRAMRHAQQRVKRDENVHARAFRESASLLMLSQDLDHDDDESWLYYEERVREILDDMHLLERFDESGKIANRLQRLRTYVDSLGRPNKCALVLVWRQLQRLVSEEEHEAALRYASLEAHATTVAEFLMMLEARTELWASQLFRMSQAPWLRGSGVTMSQRAEYRERMCTARDEHLPRAYRELCAPNAPAPFGPTWTRVAELVDSAKSSISRALSELAPSTSSRLQQEASDALLSASQLLARLMMFGEIERLLGTVSSVVRSAEVARLIDLNLVTVQDSYRDDLNQHFYQRLPLGLYDEHLRMTYENVLDIATRFRMPTHVGPEQELYGRLLREGGVHLLPAYRYLREFESDFKAGGRLQDLR